MHKDRDTMMDETINECLGQLRACELGHEELLMVAAIIKDNGGTQMDFASWFGQTKTVNNQLMATHWRSLKGSSHPVGVGTLVKLCRDHGGWIDTHPLDDEPGHELAWDAEIGGNERKRKDEHRIIKQDWLQEEELPPCPKDWDGVADLKNYLTALFAMEEHVGYVTDSWETKDKSDKVKHMPGKGCFDRTAGQLCQELDKCKGDIGMVIGDCKAEVGAWIRFNPLDGQGVKDANVTAHRFALVESDEVSIEKQYATYKQLELPIAALVHSGGRSLHAIVRIDAPDYKEYQKRVDFLFEVCRKNGLKIDKNNKNPSRLSRLPGVTRNGNKQRLVATGMGKSSWQEWNEFIAAINDDLPDIESLSTMFDNPPPMANAIIDGVLREGHKMLVSGPSKAGKSFLLLQLAVAIAEGSKWLGWRCRRGRVLYVNLELDPASCVNRIVEVYKAMGIQPDHVDDIDLWQLRGKALPMTELAPKLIRRALKRKYSAVIIDPIYKVITGDENAADQMAKFCNQFDKVCSELKCAVIYCHHHSKGEQAAKKAHDRASGSGVFARDPDALLDIIELEVTEAMRRQTTSKWEVKALSSALDKAKPNWRDSCPQDDAVVGEKLARWMIGEGLQALVQQHRPKAAMEAERSTAWRVEGILREFPPFDERRMFFSYPIHRMDDDGLLDDAKAAGEKLPQEKAIKSKQDSIDSEMSLLYESLAATSTSEAGEVTINMMAKELGVDVDTVRDRLKKGAERGSMLRFKRGVIYKIEPKEA